MNLTKKTASILVIIISVVIVLGTKFFLGQFAADVTASASAKVKGKEDAPIQIIEFIDFQCPACAHGAAYLKEVTEKYPDAIRVEVKHYPLAMHRHGYLSSRYAECAARQGKFWDFQDRLLARQSNWQRLIDPVPAFLQIAQDAHMDKKELESCIKNDESVNKMITKNRAEGRALGIKSTPTYFVNKKMVVGSKSLETDIGELLKKYGY